MGASLEHHGSLAVDNNVIYGETPMRLRWGSRDALVQGRSKRRPEARLLEQPGRTRGRIREFLVIDGKLTV
jgi:hypothetical protein